MKTEIYNLIKQGIPIKTIADNLGITEYLVWHYVSQHLKEIKVSPEASEPTPDASEFYNPENETRLQCPDIYAQSLFTTPCMDGGNIVNIVMNITGLSREVIVRRVNGTKI